MRMQYYDINIYKLDNEYKVVYMKRCFNDEPHQGYQKKNNMIGDKFACNVSRAKTTVLGYALCNDWDYFTTFTLDKRKYDRFDLEVWRKDFSQYIRNQRRIYGYNISYLLIPELHQDGAWHMHGLVSGIPWEDLHKFEFGVHPDKLVRGGYRFYPGILNKFGFHSFGKVRNKAAVSRYILKYISKGMGQDMLNKGMHLYYCSRGLNKPEVVDSGCSSCFLSDIDFSNDFMASSWIDKKEYQRIAELIR